MKKQTSIKSRLNGILLGAALAAVSVLPAGVSAQGDQGLGDMIFTAGTVTTDSHGREWAYLSWMATDLDMLLGVQYDVYAKPGDITSPNPYTFKGTAQLQADPNSISILANRSTNLGQNLSVLEDAIDQLFAEAIPSGSLSLSEKIAAVINGSLEDTEMFQNLVFMSQAHPALTLALGRGFACEIPNTGYTTFEIRDHNNDEVIGRLTVEGGNPLVLPAPANVMQVTDDSPKGHLNIRLRWESPDALRRVSLMQFGYSLYRIDKDFAEHPSRNYHITPPPTATLLSLAGSAPEVKKVNILPILPDEDNVVSNTYFIIDDNDGLTGGTPFIDGEEFYYFATALDLLGRDGDVSDGFLAQACDRVAPRVPKDIRTRALYDYDSGTGTVTQSVEISWTQDPDFAETAAYYVYRHDSFDDMNANAGDPAANLISGPISPIPGADRLYFTNTLSETQQDVTFWYTVRGMDDAACGPNISLNSAPVFGGIHDWEGPEDPVASGVQIFVQTLICEHLKTSTLPPVPGNIFELVCHREDPSIKWAEFAYYPGEKNTNPIPLGRYYFRKGSTSVSRSFDLPIPLDTQGTFFCRVGNGTKVSNWASEFIRTSGSGDMKIEFIGRATYGRSSDPGDGPHIIIPGDPEWPVLEVDVPADAGEYRFYRRVDGGPRTLIAQGPTTNSTTIIEEDTQAGLVNGGTICYYYQFFSYNGMPGPMTKIECIEVARTIDLPIPDLKPIKSTGTELASPGMDIEWFCPPQGVERFEVAVNMSQSGYPTTFSSVLREISNPGTSNYIDAVVDQVTNNLSFATYETGRVGANFGVPNEAEFLVNADVNLNVKYTIMVRALGPNGEEGEWSNAREFEWKAVPETGPTVPWPARGLPPVQEYTFHSGMAVHFLYPEIYGTMDRPRVGVRIGEIPTTDLEQPSKDRTQLLNSNDPHIYLYRDSVKTNETVFPCVLYRYQIPSPLYPEVSGDTAQVSVMMETIAWGKAAGTGFTTIYDPFIAITKKSSDPQWGIYLLDTHPVAKGANYRYLLLRFKEDGELDRIINAGDVSIPE